MITEIQIENFKSIAKLTLKPGRVTVLIGENGSGKSNILEAIAFAAAATADKLDDEFLVNRGIRVTEKEWMTSAFMKPVQTDSEIHAQHAPISFYVTGEDSNQAINQAYPIEIKITRTVIEERGNLEAWRIDSKSKIAEITEKIAEDLKSLNEKIKSPRVIFTDISKEKAEQAVNEMNTRLSGFQLFLKNYKDLIPDLSNRSSLRDFLIYAPENTMLRNFSVEGAIKPLGTKGEGLLKHLLTLSEKDDDGSFAAELNEHLNLLGWFDELHLPTEVDEMRGRLRIRDRYLSEDHQLFDQRSANEGFLYLLFYFTLMLSEQTPRFFAIDNIDSSLNPKLCAELMRQLAVLAKKHDKQIICTTHNPALLDGLDLTDDDQRLYVVRRNSDGHTVVNRVQLRPPPEGVPQVRLSEAFMSGMLGGLPDHF